MDQSQADKDNAGALEIIRHFTSQQAESAGRVELIHARVRRPTSAPSAHRPGTRAASRPRR